MFPSKDIVDLAASGTHGREALHGALRGSRRLLLIGAPGVGKSTFAADLGARIAAEDGECACLGCDPGSPAFGLPGAVCLGFWTDEAWRLADLEPLCTLDAARFRLPLARAAAKLLARHHPKRLLVDAPGVVRGVAAAELMMALVDSLEVDRVLAFERGGTLVELEAELAALPVPVHRLGAADQAHSPSKRDRAIRRTELWDAWLAPAEERWIELDRLARLGTPPPVDAAAAWQGRQLALLRASRCLATGEVLAAEGRRLRVRLRAFDRVTESPPARKNHAPLRREDDAPLRRENDAPLRREDGAAQAHGARALLARDADALLVRDAERRADGLLGTAPPAGASPLVTVDAGDDEASQTTKGGLPAGRAPTVKAGPYVATLLNGVFGDPLLLVRLTHLRRGLLFDLGDAARLPARIAHQVTDVFISHAHADHIAGFLAFLRARIGPFPACRLYGPPGLARNVAGLVGGFHWDRAGERGPRFEVAELHAGPRLARFTVSTEGPGPIPAGEGPAPDGVLLAEQALTVRAALLDHRTPVLAYALEPALEVKVRKERLAALGLARGPWLTELRLAVIGGRWDEMLRPAGGPARTTRALADELLLIRPGRKLVYATDLADTPDNRQRLAALAHRAHVMFCEATFRSSEIERARRTGHLTAAACGEIATAAEVERLVPFHFSKRYENDPGAVYREVSAACGSAVATG